jgi:hypothetical protein
MDNTHERGSSYENCESNIQNGAPGVLRAGWVDCGERFLLENIQNDTTLKPYVDADLLAELFEGTYIGDELVENVD